MRKANYNLSVVKVQATKNNADKNNKCTHIKSKATSANRAGANH